MFESFVFGEIYKSYCNDGKAVPLFFFKTNDKREIDLLLERDGILFPIEVKKSAAPQAKDVRAFSVLDAAKVPTDPTLASFKREVGTGSLICMADDTFPVSERAWAFPAWAI